MTYSPTEPPLGWFPLNSLINRDNLVFSQEVDALGNPIWERPGEPPIDYEPLIDEEETI